MAHCSEIRVPRLDIRVDRQDFGPGARAVVAQLFPEWPSDDTMISPLSGGEMNTMLCSYIASDVTRSRAIIIRVFLEGVFKETRKQEISVATILGAVGCSPKILAIIENGFVYEYAQGSCPGYSTYRDEKAMKAIFRSLIQMHEVNLEQATVVDSNSSRYDVIRELSFLEAIDVHVQGEAQLTKDPSKLERLKAEGITRPFLANELQTFREKLATLNMERVLSHNDLHMRNIVYNPQSESAVLIDFEFLAFHYEPMDLASLFFEHDILQGMGIAKEDDIPLTESDIKNCVKWYVQVKAEVKGQGEVTQEQIDNYYQLFMKCRVAVHFVWTLIFLTHVNDEVEADTDCYRMGLLTLAAYKKLRHMLID